MVQTPQGAWDNPNIALISAAPLTFPDEVLSRLERRHWHIPVRTPKIQEAFKALNTGKCSILIVHDTPELPASFVLRAQIVDPVSIITPTIVVCHPSHNQEQALIKDLGQPELIESPVNPASFIGSFEWLTRRWSQGNLRKLYQARRLFLEKQFLLFSKLLTNLKAEADLQPLVTPCMAQILMRQTDFKSVEKLLLTALKEHPRNVGIIINLVEFYMRAAMPETALKILAATRKNHGNPRLLYSDQIQAHLMLNQLKDCIPLLEALVREDYCRKQAQDFLARCLYAEGHMDRFQRMVEHQVPLIEEFKARWNKAVG
jgi:hypothetical protein